MASVKRLEGSEWPGPGEEGTGQTTWGLKFHIKDLGLHSRAVEALENQMELQWYPKESGSD